MGKTSRARTRPKPKGITNEDLQAAIVAESRILLSENRELILKRARKRLIEKFGQ